MGGNGGRQPVFPCVSPKPELAWVCASGPGLREPRRVMPCSHAHASRGATHVLRDGDEADADEREGAAGVAAGPGEGRQSDPSRGSEARHAHAWPHARAPPPNHKPRACCARELDSARERRKHRGMDVTAEP